MKIKFYRKLGAKLQQARLDNGLEQIDVTSRIGKTQSYISKIENGNLKIEKLPPVDLSLPKTTLKPCTPLAG